MALPSNDHHVHGAGYESDRGEPDRRRMLEEIADELWSIPGIDDVRVFGEPEPMIEVSYSGDGVAAEIQQVADEWAVVVEHLNDTETAHVRPT